MGKHGDPIDKIAKYGYKLVVVPRLKIFPGKIIVLGFRGVGGKGISKHVLHIWEFNQVFVQPNRPIFGSG